LIRYLTAPVIKQQSDSGEFYYISGFRRLIYELAHDSISLILTHFGSVPFTNVVTHIDEIQ